MVLPNALRVIEVWYKDRAERAYIKHMLELNNWNIRKTAEAIDIQRSHLYSKMKKYGLERGQS